MESRNPLAALWSQLRFRPLLWMGVAALLGVSLAAPWVHCCGAVDRGSWGIYGAVLPVPPLVWLGLRWRHRQFAWRLCCFAGVVCAFVSYTGRRILPPVGDISGLVIAKTDPLTPIEHVTVPVTGIVADFPARSDFNIQFPLQCSAPRRGTVWVTAPYDCPVQVGDAIQCNLELRALLTPGNAGERDTQWPSILMGCWARARVAKSEQIKIVTRAAGYPAMRRLEGLRGWLLHHYERDFGASPGHAYPAAMAQLMTAMVFGEGGLRDPLPAQERADFRAAGLSHLLVASGTQVALIASGLLVLARGLGLRRWPLLLLVVPVLVLYAAVAGGAASIWRATLGGLGLAAALLLGRDNDGLSLWSLAALVLLVFDPAIAYSLSFQLTFAATWGLLALAPGLKILLETRFGAGGAQELAALSMGAQAATLPVSLYHFGSFSAAGLGANFLAVPAAGLLVGTGSLGLLWAPVNQLNYWVCRGLSFLATVSAQMPAARWENDGFSLLGCWGLLLIFALPLNLAEGDGRELALLLKRKAAEAWQKLNRGMRPNPASILAVLLAVAFGLTLLSWRQRGDGRLHITVLDVGQGDSILVQCSGRSALIDGGSLDGEARSDVGRAVIVPALQAAGVTHLDLMVLTHSDADHCNGLRAVLREVPVDQFLDGPAAVTRHADPATLDYYLLAKELDKRHVKRLVPRAGSGFVFGAARLTELAPLSPPLEAVNNNAIVCRFDLGKTSALFTGDIEAPAEDRLLHSGENLHCTVLKVAHHGSKTSTTQAFLAAANPQMALISCGRYNKFGHPNVPVLERLDHDAIPIFRTDLSGAISVVCDGERCTARTFR